VLQEIAATGDRKTDREGELSAEGVMIHERSCSRSVLHQRSPMGKWCQAYNPWVSQKGAQGGAVLVLVGLLVYLTGWRLRRWCSWL
jgi:hypothetical protein